MEKDIVRLAQKTGGIPKLSTFGSFPMSFSPSFDLGWKVGTGPNAKWLHLNAGGLRDGSWNFYSSVKAVWWPPSELAGYCAGANIPQYFCTDGFWRVESGPYGDKFLYDRIAGWPTINLAPCHNFTEGRPAGTYTETNAPCSASCSSTWVRAFARSEELTAALSVSRPVPYANQGIYKDTGAAGISDPGVAGMTATINTELTQHPDAYPVLAAWINHEADPDNPDYPDPTLPAVPHVDFTPTAGVVEEPASTDIVARWSSSGWSPYDVRISEGRDTLTACSVQTLNSCTVRLGGWQRLHHAVDHTLRAEVVFDGKVLSTTSATVTFQPHKWSLDLTPSAREVEVDPDVGSASVDLEAALSETDLEAPYDLRIVDADSGEQIGACAVHLAPCPASASGTGLAPHPVRSFRAEVVAEGDTTPFATATAEVYFHNPSNRVDDVALDGLAAQFASPDDLCIVINRLPSTNVDPPSSVSDLSKACLELQHGGASVREILARLTVGSVPLALWLLWNQTVDTTTPANTALPAYQPAPPGTLPAPWNDAIQAAAARITALNPGLALSASNVVSIATQCIWNAAQAVVSATVCGKSSLPIFVSGADVQEATQHDLAALAQNPAWLRLNYVNETNQIGARRWYANLPACDGASAEAGLDCDEFPFYSTTQGGGAAVPTPDMKVVSATDNRTQGGYLTSFYSACGMNSGVLQSGGQSIVGGDAFLIIPIPSGISTTGLCNGKSG